MLTRHPLAVLSSYAESFFDGNYEVAIRHNPVLQRYVPALASFVRTPPVPIAWVKYEELVRERVVRTVPRGCIERATTHFEERAPGERVAVRPQPR